MMFSMDYTDTQIQNMHRDIYESDRLFLRSRYRKIYIYWNRMGISQLAHFGMRMPINIYSLYLGTYISFEDIKEVDSHDCNISRHLADD